MSCYSHRNNSSQNISHRGPASCAAIRTIKPISIAITLYRDLSYDVQSAQSWTLNSFPLKSGSPPSNHGRCPGRRDLHPDVESEAKARQPSQSQDWMYCLQGKSALLFAGLAAPRTTCIRSLHGAPASRAKTIRYSQASDIAQSF